MCRCLRHACNAIRFPRRRKQSAPMHMQPARSGSSLPAAAQTLAAGRRPMATIFEAMDHWVANLYRSGIAQSTVFHTTVLLAMALTAVGPDAVQTPVRLVCHFNAPSNSDVEVQLQEMPIAEAELVPAEDAAEMLAQASAAPEELLTEPQTIEVDDVELVSFTSDAVAEPDMADLVREVPHAIREVRLSHEDRRAGRAARGPVAAEQGVGGGGNGGDRFGGEMGRRLAAAGAQTGDVQVSIAWNGFDDIDVHVMIEPLNGGPPSVICWMSRMGFCGGFLDVDANANPGMLTPAPVENIFWARDVRRMVATPWPCTTSGIGRGGPPRRSNLPSSSMARSAGFSPWRSTVSPS